MSCNCANHSYLCNCDKTGIIVPITLDLNQCTEYEGMCALKLDNDMEKEFIKYVNECGGLEGACMKYPYVTPWADRYGILHTHDSDFSAYTNIFHIILRQKQEKMKKEQAKTAPINNPVENEKYSIGFTYVPAVEKNESKRETSNINLTNLYDLNKDKPSTKTIDVNFNDLPEMKNTDYEFDPKRTIKACNNPVKGKDTLLLHHPNDPIYDSQNRNFMNRPTNYWKGCPVSQPPMWPQNQQQVSVPYLNNTFNMAYGNGAAFSNPVNPALDLQQQALSEQTSPKVTVGGRDITNEVMNYHPQANKSLFSKSDYARAENRINQITNDENWWVDEQEFDNDQEVQNYQNQQQQRFNPYYRNNISINQPYTQQQYSGYNNGYMNYNSFYTDMYGLPTRYVPQRSNRWMRPSKEDIDNGKVPKIFVGDPKDFKPTIKPTKKVCDDLHFKVAIVRECTSDGVTWQEYVGGDKDIIKTKDKAIAEKAFNDYKNSTINSMADKQANDTYLLVKELRRYNQELADNLLWYQHNVPFDEFIEMKRECQDQLIEYRNNDPVAGAKSSVMIVGDTTLVKDPMPITDKQLKNMRTTFKSQKEKDDELVENTINKYSMDYFKFESQDNTIFSNKKVDDKIKDLQKIDNLKVIALDKDKAYNKMNKAISKLTPIKVTQKDRYVLWKKLIRGSRIMSNQSIENFDKEFDDWWNKPRIRNQNDFNEKYLNRLHELHYEHLVLMDKMQPTPDQLKRFNENRIMTEWHKFDQGSTNNDTSTYQFVKNFGFLETRMLEEDIQLQKHQLRNRYDPIAYKELARQYSAKQNFADGKGYVPTIDLMDERKYNRKRQLFIDQIFKKANRGTIT